MTTIVHGQNLNEHQTFSKIEKVNNLESESGVPSSPESMVGGISSYPMDLEWIVTSRGFTQEKIKPICPPLSQNEGRCGSSWGGRCNNNLVDYAVYCNEDNGWCGTTSEHKHAQSSDIYDWEPESCKTLESCKKEANLTRCKTCCRKIEDDVERWEERCKAACEEKWNPPARK